MREIGNPDLTTVFEQYVFTLCLTIVSGGRLERVKTKLRLPHFSTLYKNCKLYRLALIDREATRLIAHNHEVFTPGVKEDTLIIYHHPSILRTLLLALNHRICHRKAYTLLVCKTGIRILVVVSHSLILSRCILKHFCWSFGFVCYC